MEFKIENVCPREVYHFLRTGLKTYGFCLYFQPCFLQNDKLDEDVRWCGMWFEFCDMNLYKHKLFRVAPRRFFFLRIHRFRKSSLF
jgi:hypothetical protein